MRGRVTGRAAHLTIALLLAGCGTSDSLDAGADMTARTWQYYASHPGEIERVQKICRQWSGSNAPAGSQPAVITTNCRAAAFAKSQLQLSK